MGPNATFFFLIFLTTNTVSGLSYFAALSVIWPFLTNHCFLRCFSSMQMASSTQMDELIFVRSDSVSASSMDAISKSDVECVLRDLSHSPLSLAALSDFS